MKVSVIICTYSKENVNNTIDAVKSVLNQSYNDIEVIVVMDRDEELHKRLREKLPESVRIVVNEKPGLSNARNIGYKHAKGDIIAYLDDDAVANRNWISRLVANYAEPDVIAVGGRIEPIWEGGRPSWFPEELDWIVGCTYKGHPEERCEVRNVIGCNMSFRREVFERVGSFRTDIGRRGKNLLAGEEMEFSVRALNTMPNSRIIYDPTAIVKHRVPKKRQTIEYALRRAWNEGKSKGKIKRLEKQLGSHCSLSVEQSYLSFILKRASLIQSRMTKDGDFLPSLTRSMVLPMAAVVVCTSYLMTLEKVKTSQ